MQVRGLTSVTKSVIKETANAGLDVDKGNPYTLLVRI